MSHPKTATLLLVALLAVGSRLYAQTSFGEVNGTVSEQTGAVVPGVAVTLINQATNVETKRSTNESGYFTFVNVRPSPYSQGRSRSNAQTPHSQGVNETRPLHLAGSGEITRSSSRLAEMLQRLPLSWAIVQQEVSTTAFERKGITQLLILSPVSTVRDGQAPDRYSGGREILHPDPDHNASIQGQQNHRRSTIWMESRHQRCGTSCSMPDIDLPGSWQSHNAKASMAAIGGG
jgi:hypothetical protein